MKHPLHSTGTHQTARLLRAIAPGHFRLDERSMQDLITAAHSYARMLTYTSPGGQPDGDWAAFWEVENLTYMAVLAAIDTRQLRRDYENIDLEWGNALEEQKEKPSTSRKKGGDKPVSAEYLRKALINLRDMATRLEKHYITLRDSVPLKAHILNLIKKSSAFEYDATDVEGLLQQLIGFHKGADDHLDPLTYKHLWQTDGRWGVRDRDDYDGILVVEDCTREQARDLFVKLYNIFLTLQAQAQRMFDEELARIELPEEELERRLEPHIALFIAFLRLFRHAQEGMNDLPRRHLDFYYNSVLCLERKPAQPDHAYLIFTLAKEFEQELVEKGTLLLAGKDKKGKPIRFETLERWKVTKASIEEIRNTAITPNFINASTISEKGAPPAGAFRPFGDDASDPQGELGFAIASPQLFLQEGKREVTVKLELEGEIEYANVFASDVYVQYSTAEGYHRLDKLSPDKAGNLNGFVFNPVVSPFEPLKTIEPIRRIVGELVSDEVISTFTVGANSPALHKDLTAIYNRYASGVAASPIPIAPDADLLAWFHTQFYYPALSGVYLISRILHKESSDNTNTINGYRAELYFYRAYYLWCLATVCQPAPQFGTSQSGPNISLNTNIPDLTDFALDAPTVIIKPEDCFTLKGLYDQVEADLLNSLLHLTGNKISAASEFKAKPAPESNTSINIYTVSAMLSRYHMQMRNWSTCLDWCKVVTGSPFYNANDPIEGKETREETAERVFKSIFEQVESSQEVIWAMNAVPGDQAQTSPQSLFAVLGSRDLYALDTTPLFFAESPLLNEVNKQNLRYDEREWLVSPPPPPTPSEEQAEGEAKSVSQPLKASGGASKKTAAKKAAAQLDLDDNVDPETNPYDYRDKVAYHQQAPHWYTSKYFSTPTTTFVPMIRRAEVMLNEAWCLLQTSTSSESNKAARTLLNTLRLRAGALPFEKSETTGGTGHVVDEILPAHVEEERMRELAFEGDRRDFVRLSRGCLVGRNYEVLSTDPDVLTLGQNHHLAPAKNTLILTATGRGQKAVDWDSPWLHLADLLPLPANLEISRLKQLEANSTITLKLTLKEDAPPFLPDPALAASGKVPYPILRVTFDGKDKASKGSGFYNFLKKQTIKSAAITTQVTGIQKSIVLQNDFGVFDGTQRFYPFGPVPENSARFFLGCQEAFSKSLTEVSVHFDWVEEEPFTKVPALRGYNDHYQNYQKTTDPKVTYFPNPKVSIDLLKEAEFTQPLFPPTVAGQSSTDRDKAASMFVIRTQGANSIITETPEPITTDTTKKNTLRRTYSIQKLSGFGRVPYAEQVTKYSATQRRGFLRFRLEGDFGHGTYRYLVMQAAAKVDGFNMPLDAYTPATNSVSLSYSSTQIMEDPSPGQTRLDYFFHLLPFGGIAEASFGGGTSLVYDYPNPDNKLENDSYFPASLFLGIKNLTPGDNLSLLFQTQEASELLPDSRPPKVHWMYLTAQNKWLEVPVQKILRDTTRGLTRSGLLQIATPNDPGEEISSRDNTLLNPALLWLRASVVETNEAPEKVGAFPSLLTIRAQAIEAQFLPAEDNDLTRLTDPLPAQSVSGLADATPGIKKVEQPFDSFGGRQPEVEGSPEYHRRISERLRHKDRAVTAWDYERLLLEDWPQVAIAKCIPHTRYESTEGYTHASQLAPGFVTVAVVPDLSRHPNMVREQPRFSRGDLEEMRDGLLPHTNAFVQTRENKTTRKRTDFLQVVNPRYEPVSIAVKVWLTAGTDQSWAIYTLDQRLRHFLAPWLNDPARLPQFSRSIRRSHLIQLIEEMDFVDAVEDISIYHYPGTVPQGKPVLNGSDALPGTVINPGTARSILTTGAHLIEISTGAGGRGGPAPRKVQPPPPPPEGGERPHPQPLSKLERGVSSFPLEGGQGGGISRTGKPKSKKK